MTCNDKSPPVAPTAIKALTPFMMTARAMRDADYIAKDDMRLEAGEAASARKIDRWKTTDPNIARELLDASGDAGSRVKGMVGCYSDIYTQVAQGAINPIEGHKGLALMGEAISRSLHTCKGGECDELCKDLMARSSVDCDRVAFSATHEHFNGLASTWPYAPESRCTCPFMISGATGL